MHIACRQQAPEFPLLDKLAFAGSTLHWSVAVQTNNECFRAYPAGGGGESWYDGTKMNRAEDGGLPLSCSIRLRFTNYSQANVRLAWEGWLYINGQQKQKISLWNSKKNVGELFDWNSTLEPETSSDINISLATAEYSKESDRIVLVFKFYDEHGEVVWVKTPMLHFYIKS
jgi:hypothetical protein